MMNNAVSVLSDPDVPVLLKASGRAELVETVEATLAWFSNFFRGVGGASLGDVAPPSAPATGGSTYLGLTIDQSGALFLLVGGLTILAAVIPMTMLRTRFDPDRREAPVPRRVDTDTDDGDAPRNGRSSPTAPARPDDGSPIPELRQKGRQEGARLAEDADQLDDVLDRIEARWTGRVRIEATHGDGLTLAARERPRPDRMARSDNGSSGCLFACGLFEGALSPVFGRSVIVEESSCAGSGASNCVFEVMT